MKQLLAKKPFLRISSAAISVTREITGDMTDFPVEDVLTYYALSQADFLREYEPTGHKINSQLYYPDKILFNEEDKKYYIQPVIRCAFPFQQVIATKHLCHLCGNDIQFEISTPREKEKDTDTFFDFCKGWLNKNMEVTWHEAAKSAKITGDCAIAFYMNKGKMRTKNFSFLNRDVLYPHYDEITGELSVFARTYSDIDPETNLPARFCEVWDSSHLHFFKESTEAGADANPLDTIGSLKNFTLPGFIHQKSTPHNFSQIPIAYHRVDSGACWTPGQDAIDKYELAISHLSMNNMAYAFPIMVLKGDDIRIKGDVYGNVKAIFGGKDDSADYLSNPESSAAFDLQLRTLLQQIFTGTFTVLPPEVKSGDLPGVAIKLLFSPAVEKAMQDAKEFNPFIDKLTELFKEGYGIETGNSTKYAALSIFGWIKPYVHQNDTELFSNASTAVQNKYLSRQTASELATLAGYGKNYEWDRVSREEHYEQMADLLTDIKRKQIAQQPTLDISAGSQRQTSQGLHNINVNPDNKRIWDENGNWPGRNNWDTWNATHQ